MPRGPVITSRTREVWAAVKEHGGQRPAARALGISLRAVQDHIAKAQRLVDDQGPALSQPRQVEDSIGENGTRVVSAKGIRTLADLLDAAMVNVDEWDVAGWRANAWEAQRKDGSVQQLHQVKANLVRRPGWWSPGVQAVDPPEAPTLAKTAGNGRCLILPDSQHGFTRQADDTLLPMHDNRACSIAVEAARMLRPEAIVLLGDMLDLAPWSTYSTDPGARYTTQPALEALHRWLRQLREAAPDSRIVYLEGNHEHRIVKCLRDRLDEGLGLRRVGEDLELLSIPSLLDLRALSVEYVAPYGEDWWWGDVRFHHGSTVRGGGGKTVAAMLGNATHHQVVGHIHRREIASRTIRTRDGWAEVTALSPGCLCHTDGRVPAAAGRKGEDWQQGLAVATRLDGGTHLANVPIVNGQAVIWGNVLTAA